MKGDRERDDGSEARKYMEQEFPTAIRELMWKHCTEIYVQLLEQQEHGFTWVAYPDEKNFDRNDMQFFDEAFYAYEYCHEGCPDHMPYDYNSIAKLIDVLEPIVEHDVLIRSGIRQPDNDKDHEDEMER